MQIDKNNKKQSIFGNIISHVKDTVDLYDELACIRMQSKQVSRYKKCRHDKNKFAIDMMGTYDESRITLYYTFENLPKELDRNYRNIIRSACRKGVHASFIDKSVTNKINWESPEIESRRRALKIVSDDMDNKDVDPFNYWNNVDALDSQEWVKESLIYLADATKKRNCRTFSVACMMVITGVRSRDFNASVHDIEDICKNTLGINAVRVLYDVPDVLQCFSPFTTSFVYDTKKRISTFLLTDETYALMNSYEQGILGSRGIYFGTDIISKFPVLKKVKNTAESTENWLITAESEGGKSVMVKTVSLEMLAQGFYGTIMDVEGDEYAPLANLLSYESKVVVLNMGEGSGKYFDAVEILCSGIEKIDKDAKKSSIDFTVATFRVLLGKEYDISIWADAIINDALALLYADNNVTNDMSTWGNSAGLTYFDVYKYMSKLKETVKDKPKEYYREIGTCVTILSKYFESWGTRGDLFNTRVKIKDIMDAELVVCSFGMAGKSPDSVDAIQMALMGLSAAQISQQRSVFCKAKGLFNFKVWEEFQRWSAFKGSVNTIGVAVTGGRKLGDINIIVTNKVSELLEDDRFGIMTNLSSYLIGGISSKVVREHLCEQLSIPDMLPELDKIAMVTSNTKNTDVGTISADDESVYKHAFVCCLDNSEYAVVKVQLPDFLIKSDLFRTGVEINDTLDNGVVSDNENKLNHVMSEPKESE